MKTYRLRLKPLAPWVTPWHADTLFAALACQVAQRTGADSLRRMLEGFIEGEPPFVLSDALPEGWFPCPLSVSLQKLEGSNLKAKVPIWTDENQFRSLITQPAPLVPKESWPTPLASSRSLHASIDRALGTTGDEGNLFEIEGWHLQPTPNGPTEHLVIYVRTQSWLERLVDLFRSLGAQGFGKRKTAGSGAFELKGEPEPADWLDQLHGANAFVSLSHFLPAPADPSDGRWSLLVKYPKFSPGVPTASPFKGRLLMLRPGSVFRIAGQPLLFYGRMLRGLSPEFPQAVHYGLAFPVPMRWPEEAPHE